MRHTALLRLSAMLALSAAAPGCQMQSEAPDVFLKEFRAATTTKFYTGADARAAVNTGECVVLAAKRVYTAPQGRTQKGDIRNVARGVDATVKLDGGNAYRIIGHGWVPANYGTALAVTFDTLLCEPPTGSTAAPVKAPPT